MAKSGKLSGLGVVVVAGGSGSRFGRSNKLLAKIAGVPVFIHPLRNFHRLCLPGCLVLVVRRADSAEFADCLRRFLNTAEVRIVPGGKTRMHSVLNGLAALPDAAKFAAVHDAARPMATAELLRSAYGAARRHGSAVTAKRVTDTVKKADTKCRVIETVDRNSLWRVETPQIFQTAELKAAYVKAFKGGRLLTDDSAVMENAGFKPYLFEWKLPNDKITFPEDLKSANMHLSRRSKYDIL